MNHIVVDMFYNYACKNSHRYDAKQQVGKPPLNAVYIANEAFQGDTPPRNIRITITEGE